MRKPPVAPEVAALAQMALGVLWDRYQRTRFPWWLRPAMRLVDRWPTTLSR
jgi:hypothetical protein